MNPLNSLNPSRSMQTQGYIFKQFPELLAELDKHFLSESASSFDWFLAHQLLSYELKTQPNLELSEQLCLCLLVLALRQAIARGQACIKLDEFAYQALQTDLEALNSQLASFSIIQTDESIDANTPIIVDGSYAYFQRYYAYQQTVFEQLQARVKLTRKLDIALLKDSLDGLFPQSGESCDWQKVAAAIACLKRLSVITGGPGTGKTTTVAKLLACLLQQNANLNIALAAPTGKAAARMMESLRQARQHIPMLATMKLPEKSYTLHRLLGHGGAYTGLKHHQDNPLEADLVIVDEASMIDLPMMSHLLCALKEDAGLILLGDENQLSSVEVGSVLADMSASNERINQQHIHQFLRQELGMNALDESLQFSSQSASQSLPKEPVLTGGLANNMTKLKTSYRFDEHSAIGHLAKAINRGQSQQALAILQQQNDEITWFDSDWELVKNSSDCVRDFYQGLSRYMNLMLSLKKGELVDRGEILDALTDFQILVATRSGKAGLEQMNDWAQRLLSVHGVIDASSTYYSGQPIMVSQNNADLGLFNGDVGVILPSLNNGSTLVACFRQMDGSMREIMPSRLPEHTTAFAITVHKSQGSEFKQVMLVLPDSWIALLNRQLIYTALTRAKKQFSIIAPKECIIQSIEQQSLRASGLKEKLWSVNG